MSVLTARFGIECGQSLLARRSWRRPWWRRFPHGIALGPIMIWRPDLEDACTTCDGLESHD